MIEKRKLIATTLLGISLIGGVVYKTQISSRGAEKIEKAVVKKGSLNEKLTLSGEIKADEAVTLRFQTSGYLADVAVSEGDFVNKGQYIASLDKRELEKDLKKKLNDFKSKR